VEQSENDAACERNMGYAKTQEDKVVSIGKYPDKTVAQGQGETTQKCKNLQQNCQMFRRAGNELTKMQLGAV
jgi:hypothetical protein